MTNAQMKVKTKQIIKDILFAERKFRKGCVTQGIVKFVKDFDFYEMKYRGHFVCYLRGKNQDSLQLMSVWNAIQIAERTIKNICRKNNQKYIRSKI